MTLRTDHVQQKSIMVGYLCWLCAGVCGVILSASSTRKVHFVGDHVQDGLPVVAEAMMDCETSGWLKVTAVCVDATETQIKNEYNLFL